MRAYELDALLTIASQYLNAFSEEDMMTLPEKLLFQDVKAAVEKYGRWC